MSLTARQKAAKVEGRMYAKELVLSGYRVKLESKSPRVLMRLTAAREAQAVLVTQRGRWYLRRERGGLYWETLCSANRLSEIMVHVREWLEENHAE